MKLNTSIWNCEVQSSLFFDTNCFESFEELAKCSQNMADGQCDVSKRLVYRHIIKSIVKELKEKKKKFHFSKLELNLSVCMQSAALILPEYVLTHCFPNVYGQHKEWSWNHREGSISF